MQHILLLLRYIDGKCKTGAYVIFFIPKCITQYIDSNILFLLIRCECGVSSTSAYDIK